MQTAPAPSQQGWHIGQWGLWGWIETALKLVGIAAGLYAFFLSAGHEIVIAGNTHFLAVIILVPLTLIWCGTILLRFQQREVISLVFSVLQALGHLGLLIALLRLADRSIPAVVLGVAYVMGEYARQRFFAASGYTEMGSSPERMTMIARLFMTVYMVFTVLVLL